MNVTCLALEPGGGLRPEPEATAVASWKAGSGAYWIHLTGGDPEAVAAWLSGLGLDAELLRYLAIDDEETRILPLADAVFVAYPVPGDEDARGPGHFHFLCLERLVITMHERTDTASIFDEFPIAKVKIREASTAGVVCALTLVHATRLRRRITRLRREADGIAGRMDADPPLASLEEILALKRRVEMLGEAVEEELAVLDVLKVSNRPALPLSQLAEVFGAVVGMVRAADRDLERLDRRVEGAQRRYESAQQDQTNRRLGLLTALSAIFMPLTFIAGIYGMNFEFMPELHFRYSYPILLVVMALLAWVLFRMVRSRWLPKPGRHVDHSTSSRPFSAVPAPDRRPIR